MVVIEMAHKHKVIVPAKPKKRLYSGHCASIYRLKFKRVTP